MHVRLLVLCGLQTLFVHLSHIYQKCSDSEQTNKMH